MVNTVGVGTMRKTIAGADDFQRILFELLLTSNNESLDEKKKKEYSDFFINESSEEFIEDIPYDIITEFIYEKNIYNIENLNTIFRELEETIERDTKSDTDKKILAKKCLKKLIRNIRLALVQQKYISDKRNEIYILNSKIDEAQATLQRVQKELDDKVKDVEKNIYSNQMSVLGIFASVVVVFIGGFGASVNLISNLVNSVPLTKILMISSLLFMGIACIVYLLLVISSRITKHGNIPEVANKTFYRIFRILALLCLVSALIYQLQFSRTSFSLIQQGIWYSEGAKAIEFLITIIMIVIVLIPKPVFVLKNWLNR